MLRTRMNGTRRRTSRHALHAVGGSGLVVAFSAVGCFTGDTTGPGATILAVKLRGCTVEAGSPPPVAPRRVLHERRHRMPADGTEHLFHGVDRPTLEWDPAGEGPTGAGIPASDFQMMATWHANVVRIALNQDYWLPKAALYKPFDLSGDRR